MSNSNNDILLAISTPPFWHCGRTIRKNSIHTLIALAPAVVLSLIQWGMPAARVMALAVVVSLVTEAVCQTLMKQKLSQDNGTAAITGLLLAFLLPVSAPWWLVVIAAVCAMGIGRMAFGGYGANQVNATLVGWALVFVSFPLYMDPTASVLHTSLIDPLLKAKYFGGAAVADFPLTDLLLGRQLGRARRLLPRHGRLLLAASPPAHAALRPHRRHSRAAHQNLRHLYRRRALCRHAHQPACAHVCPYPLAPLRHEARKGRTRVQPQRGDQRMKSIVQMILVLSILCGTAGFCLS